MQVASLAQLLPPRDRSPTVSNPALDSSLCRAATPRLRPLAPRLCPFAPRLRPLQLLLAACVRFESAAARAPGPDCIRFHSCCSPIASASTAAPRLCPLQLLLPVCVCFHSCCSSRSRPLQLLLPIASALAAAPRLRPLQLLLPDCIRFNCCSPDCVRLDCCSPITCIRLQPQLDSSPMFLNIPRGVRGSVNKLKYEGCMSL